MVSRGLDPMELGRMEFQKDIEALEEVMLEVGTLQFVDRKMLLDAETIGRAKRLVDTVVSKWKENSRGE